MHPNCKGTTHETANLLSPRLTVSIHPLDDMRPNSFHHIIFIAGNILCLGCDPNAGLFLCLRHLLLVHPVYVAGNRHVDLEREQVICGAPKDGSHRAHPVIRLFTHRSGTGITACQ